MHSPLQQLPVHLSQSGSQSEETFVWLTFIKTIINHACRGTARSISDVGFYPFTKTARAPNTWWNMIRKVHFEEQNNVSKSLLNTKTWLNCAYYSDKSQSPAVVTAWSVNRTDLLCLVSCLPRVDVNAVLFVFLAYLPGISKQFFTQHFGKSDMIRIKIPYTTNFNGKHLEPGREP